MKLIDVMTGPWAIAPDKLTEIRSIYETHLRGEKIDVKALEARLGKPLNNQPQGYDVANGVAIIPVEGVIAKKMNLLTQISGGVSTDLLARDFQAALDDPAVDFIILNIDSPGGTVDGTAEIANMIFNARGVKPIAAFTDGAINSAAYWIAAAADRIFISGDTTCVGSIGVITSHTDISKSQDMAGKKTTVITAGKYKGIATEHAPLSEAGAADIQSRVDYIYSVFVADVAKFRGVAVGTVLADMADGRLYIGKQAITAGLVDGVSTLDQLVADLASSGGVPDNTGAKSKTTEAIMAGNEMVITAELLAEKHPEVFKAIQGQGYAQGQDAGAKAERERIQGVFALSRPGREELIKGLMFDGKTTKAEASEKILEAEDARKAAMLKNLNADANNTQAAYAEAPAATGIKDFDALVAEYQEQYKCNKPVAISAVAKAFPKEHEEYITKINAKA